MFACSDDSNIGSELLNNESLNLEFVDISPLPMSTVTEDPVPLFIIGDFGTSDLSTYPLGSVDEPIFGSNQTTIFMDIHKSVGTPEFDGKTLDSIVLLLPYDTLGTYGNLDASHLIEVFELTEGFEEDVDTFFSNTSFAYEPVAIGSVDLVPNTRDSVFAYAPTEDSIIGYLPHLRIKLDDAFAMAFFEENDGVVDDTTFIKENFGFAIRSTPSDNSFFGLNLANSSLNQRELAVYYSEVDSAIRYDFPVAVNRSYFADIDYSGSDIETALTDPAIGDSLLYVQGMEGVNIKIDLSALDDLSDVSLNVAELEFFVAELGEDNLDLYPPIDAFYLAYEDEDGDRVFIEDYVESLSISNFFGGTLEDDTNGLKKYTLGVTSHVLDIISGEIASKELFLVPVRREQEVNRTILYGPNHSQYPAKLRLVITTN